MCESLRRKTFQAEGTVYENVPGRKHAEEEKAATWELQPSEEGR